MNIIKVIIIKANKSQAKEINDTLEMHCPYVEVVGIANDIITMESLIRTNNYDLIILGLNTAIDFAFKFLKNSSCIKKKELIIINTDNKKSALTYINNTYDDVLRSIDSTQMIVAIQKAKKQIFSEENTLQPLNDKVTKLNLIGIPSLKEVKIIKVSSILYLKSEGKYTIFHDNNNKTVLSSRNLGEYEKQLINNNFLRIHNSYLVNMDNAIKIQKKDGIYIKMMNNENIPVSKRKKEMLFQFLGIK